MSNYSAGHQAEKVAAEYLEGNGYKIKVINWQTPMCEIDIVAEKNSVMYFIEVKFRSSDQQGGGLEYITPAKLRQMEFAAKNWVQAERYEGDWELGGLEVSSNYQVGEFISELT